MEITIKFDATGVAVYQNGQCIRRDLSPEDAERLARELLNRDFARPRV